MSQGLEYLRANNETIKAIATRHNVRSISVFASVARGEDRPDGDIDFLQVDIELVDQGGLFPRDAHIRDEALAL